MNNTHDTTFAELTKEDARCHFHTRAIQAECRQSGIGNRYQRK